MALPGFDRIKLDVEGEKVYLQIGTLEAMARHIAIRSSGEIVLEGEARMCCKKVGEVRGDHISINLRNGTPEILIRATSK